MVSCYGYEIWRHKQQVGKPILGENTCFFNFFNFNNKSSLVAKIMQNAYLYAFFHVKHLNRSPSNGASISINFLSQPFPE